MKPHLPHLNNYTHITNLPVEWIDHASCASPCAAIVQPCAREFWGNGRVYASFMVYFPTGQLKRRPYVSAERLLETSRRGDRSTGAPGSTSTRSALDVGQLPLENQHALHIIIPSCLSRSSNCSSYEVRIVPHSLSE